MASHLLYTSVGLSGVIRSIVPTAKPDGFIKALEHSYKILKQGNIVIAQRDINNLFQEKLPGRDKDEFYIFTPSHIDDDRKTYFQLTEIEHIKKFIKNAGKENVNFIMTLGDNNTFRTPNLNFVLKESMTRLIRMSSLHENKRLIVYASSGVFSIQDELKLRKEMSQLLSAKMRLLKSQIIEGESNNELKETYAILSHDLTLLESATKYDTVLDGGYYNAYLPVDTYYRPETPMELENPFSSNKDEIKGAGGVDEPEVAASLLSFGESIPSFSDLLPPENSATLPDSRSGKEELLTSYASKKRKLNEGAPIKMELQRLSFGFSDYCKRNGFGGFAVSLNRSLNSSDRDDTENERDIEPSSKRTFAETLG